MNKIELKHDIINSRYTEYIYDTYDIQNTEQTVTEINYDLSKLEDESFKWNIGVIYGASGSGKTSVLKDYGKLKDINFDESKPLIQNFDFLEPSDACKLLSSMGLSSVPSWLRPYKTLSNGEQYRAKLAYLVANSKDGETILVDEYTSVVDRNVAKSMSFALQKYIRKHNKKIILACCHYDIMEWLTPDWTCSPQKGGALEIGEYRLGSRPKIELQVSRVEYGTWDLFKKHHYLTELNNKSYAHYLFTWNGVPVGINVISPLPSPFIKRAFRESRIVVLPDFQGLGLGYQISNFTGAIYKADGRRYYTKTVHPALGESRNKNTDDWRPTGDNGKVRKKRNAPRPYESHWAHNSRISYCHEYIGSEVHGYDELIKPIKEMRKDKKLREKQQKLQK